LKRLIIAYLFFLSTSTVFLLVTRPLWVPGGSDFSAFYAAGSTVRSGNGNHLYDYAEQAKAQEQFTRVLSYRKIPLLFPHPPFETALFAPLSFLHYRTAFVVWWAINQMFLLLAFLILQKTLTHVSVLPVTLACLAVFFPLQHAFVLGQDSVLLMLVLCVSFFALMRDREFLAGAALAVGLIKPQLTLPIYLLLAVRSSRKFTLGFLSSCVVLLALSFALVGYGGVASFLPFLSQFSSMPQEISGSYPSQMANIHGLLYRLGFTSSAAVLALSAVLLIASLVLTRKSPKPALMASAVAVALVVSYHAMEHDLTLLILPFIITMDRLMGEQIRGFARVALTLSAFGMMWAPALYLGPMWKLASMIAFTSVAWMDIGQESSHHEAATI
jgi:alpha-1,2-mannosyltransferase